MNKLIPTKLMYFDRLRLKFDKCFDIDSGHRASIVKRMEENQYYSDLEMKQIDNGRARMRDFDLLPKKKQIKSASPLASSEVAQKTGDRLVFGKSSIVVRASLLWYE